MKPTLHLLPAVLSLLLLTGCATQVWYQPGKTEAQMRQDWAESQLAAKRAALGVRPPILATDNDFAMGLAWRAQHDAASAAKDVGILTMQSKGYQLVPLPTLPANATYLKP